jgi:hypothetical protein
MANTNINTRELWDEIQNISIKPTQKLLHSTDYFDLNKTQCKVCLKQF